MSSPELVAPAGDRLVDRWTLLAAGLAGVVVLGGLGLGWRGVDLPAQLYRIELFRQHGFALWDSGWYAGHWLLDYSVLFPALAATVGVGAVTVAAAAVAAAGFHRLVAGCSQLAGGPAAVVFAVGMAVEAAIGQLTFLGGAAVGLWAVVLASRRRWRPAVAAAVVASLVSPLDGAFVTLALVSQAWATPTGGRRPPLVAAAACAAPVVALGLVFPGQGSMPFPPLDYVWELAVAAGLWSAAGRAAPVVRRGIVLYAVALTASVVVATPLGGNVGRLEDVAALPLAVGLLWGRRRVLLAVVAVPLALSQWSPAWAAMTSSGSRPWTQRAYYAPLVTELRHLGGPPGRVEVVPTAGHWEAADVAPAVPLARGWERQLDEADAPLFYARVPLDATTYLAWLRDNGVRFVALPDAPLDEAGVAEGRLVVRHLPGLRPVWHDRHWRLWQVADSTGIAGPGVAAVHLDGGRLTVALPTAGPAEVRVRWSPAWRVTAGAAQTFEWPGGWLGVDAAAPGPVMLRVRLGG